MSKDKISDYSTTANSNTDIGGINVDEGCAPSGINDAIRTLMAQLKTWQSGGQDVYIHPAGSASVPSITATGDTNTGIFFPAADTVGISTGGTERARVDSSGNLGLGVTPSAWNTFKGMQLVGGSLMSFSNAYVDLWQNSYYDGSNVRYVNTGYASYYRQNSGQHQWFTAASGTSGNVATFTQAMTLDASGNLGVGQTSLTNTRLWVESTYTRMMLGYNNTSINYFDCDENVFRNRNGSERARIDSSGNLLVGRTSGFPSTSSFGCYFGADGTLSSSRNVNGTSAVAQIFGNAGEFRVYGNGTYATISDARIKENVVDATPKLQDLMGVRIVNYNIIGDDQKQLGVIAQELAEVFPSLVDNGESEEDTKAVRYSVFVPILIKAIQEQQAIITQLQADVAALKGQA